MCKLIIYWKLNFKTKLGFYGIDQRKQTWLSNEEINLRIAEAFADVDKEEYDETPPTRRTIDGKEIPEDNCIVLIEDVWIDNLVDLSHELITKEIGDIPIDISYDSDEYDKGDDKTHDKRDDDVDDNSGKGVLDYDINDLIGDDDSEWMYLISLINNILNSYIDTPIYRYQNIIENNSSATNFHVICN